MMNSVNNIDENQAILRRVKQQDHLMEVFFSTTVTLVVPQIYIVKLETV